MVIQKKVCQYHGCMKVLNEPSEQPYLSEGCLVAQLVNAGRCNAETRKEVGVWGRRTFTATHEYGQRAGARRIHLWNIEWFDSKLISNSARQ
jgi:hypothetical protein